jgi:hypothetical protein
MPSANPLTPVFPPFTEKAASMADLSFCMAIYRGSFVLYFKI